jgi:hypothetical protein
VDGTLVSVALEAVIRLNPQGNGIHVVSGRVAVKRDIVQQATGLTNPFVTKSPTAEVTHVNTIYEVFYDPTTDATTVRAIEGRLIVTPTNTSLSAATLTAGQQILVSGDQISGVSALTEVPEDPFARLGEGELVRTGDRGTSDGNGTVVFLLVGLLVLGIIGTAIAVMGSRRGPIPEASGAAAGAGVAATTMQQAGPTAAVASDPPGWYPDPTGEARMRYWDGMRWTESTSG